MYWYSSMVCVAGSPVAGVAWTARPSMVPNSSARMMPTSPRRMERSYSMAELNVFSSLAWMMYGVRREVIVLSMEILPWAVITAYSVMIESRPHIIASLRIRTASMPMVRVNVSETPSLRWVIVTSVFSP